MARAEKEDPEDVALATEAVRKFRLTLAQAIELAVAKKHLIVELGHSWRDVQKLATFQKAHGEMVIHDLVGIALLVAEGFIHLDYCEQALADLNKPPSQE